ncbi:MAG: NADH-quinone oxidoreductase subunit C [Alphaproteobacteria bacterium]|jgi:NADH-quinone oxidoreductase subunit C|nr:NADH-quinone oxidoreductase subunit C [Alphaproteobacteria bacterium]MBT5828332.1 NADH-quinone oxidoreductase subunit C [Alphaproteobacteria bacterium]
MDKSLINHLEVNFTKAYQAELFFVNDEAVLTVGARNMHDLLRSLRDDTKCLFAMLVSICGVDYPHLEKRFEVVYNLLSLKNNARIRVKVKLAEKESISSVRDLFNAAAWYEREAFDMYGIKFSGDVDLRRILTDYGFTHHPLRKDFPVTGYEEVRYDIEKKEVVYEPVKLDQEFRDFDYLSPWEGDFAKQILPGDEKAFDNLAMEEKVKDEK